MSSVIASPCLLTYAAARRAQQAGAIADRSDCTVFRWAPASNLQVNAELPLGGNVPAFAARLQDECPCGSGDDTMGP